jgi:hypothetical protein
MKPVWRVVIAGISLVALHCSGEDNPTSTSGTSTATSTSSYTSTSTSSTTTTSICRSDDVTETVEFSLPPPGQAPSVDVGPFPAGPGKVFGEVRFTRGYVLCTCVGTAGRCRPFCEPTPTVEFRIDVPGDFPPGNIEASIYYNTNFPNPAVGGSGQFIINYRTHCP